MPDELRKKIRDNLEAADPADLPPGTERVDDRGAWVDDAQTALVPPDELAAILERADSYREAEADYATGPGIDRRMGGPTGGDMTGGTATGESSAPGPPEPPREDRREKAHAATEEAMKTRAADANWAADHNRPRRQ